PFGLVLRSAAHSGTPRTTLEARFLFMNEAAAWGDEPYRPKILAIHSIDFLPLWDGQQSLAFNPVSPLAFLGMCSHLLPGDTLDELRTQHKALFSAGQWRAEAEIISEERQGRVDLLRIAGRNFVGETFSLRRPVRLRLFVFTCEAAHAHIS